MLLTLESFKKKIEYSLCQQFADDNDVHNFCDRAKNTGAGVVCVNPVNVGLTVELLKDESIEISSNIGFPFGSHITEVKVLETQKSVEDGADQIDVVANIGALRSKKDDVVLKDIEAVVEAAEGRIVKVIIETWVLNREEKERACLIAQRAGAGLVKTTTGVRTQYLKLMNDDPKGAVLEDIILMRKILNGKIKIKASGGIYTVERAIEFIKAGADQLGVSRGERLIEEFIEKYGESVEINMGA